MGGNALEAQRIDKWLWAARFFKTRVLANSAIENGKINVNQQRCKASRNVRMGDVVEIKRQQDNITVEIVALNEQRRPAPEAQALYLETEASILLREQLRKAYVPQAKVIPGLKPNKKERRISSRIKRLGSE